MQKIIVVTGASTGIGYSSVKLLVQKGFKVVATVRKQADVDKLKNEFSELVCPILVDVADFAAVEKIPEILKKNYQIEKINGLVNNAGVAQGGPFKYQDFSEVQSMVQVNILGLMKVTQVLIPLMQTDSRIVNISSVAGKGALPFLSVYAATKHAVEGFSEGLRREMNFLGIKVSIVGPGSIKTPIWDKGLGSILPKYSESEFGPSFNKFSKMVQAEVETALPAEVVAEDVLHAVMSKNPKIRYAPVPKKIRNWYLPNLLPVCLVDKMVIKVLGLAYK